jgi:hypothetical protein
MRREASALSTSSGESKFLVYVYLDKAQGEPFYIGKTRVEKRVWDQCPSRRTGVFLNRFNEAEEISVVVLPYFTEEQAERMEKYLIREIGRRDLGTGSLVNLTDGGNGLNGYVCPLRRKKEIGDFHRGKVVSMETRMKMSIAHKGKTTWNKGKKHSPETIEKIRKASTGRKASAETREKMRQSQLKRWE